MGILREAMIRVLNEPVPSEPEEDYFVVPRPISQQEIEDIPKLPTVGDAANLHNDIQAHIDLIECQADLAAKAERLENLRKANGAPRCRHALLRGERCGAPALKDEEYCRFHRTVHAPEVELPMIEDVYSLQIAYMSVARQLMNKNLDAARAKVLLQAIECAADMLPADED